MDNYAKLIKTTPKWTKHHIRDEDVGVEHVTNRRDGLSRFTTICGITILGKQTVNERIKREELCGNCKNIAKSRRIDLDNIYKDSSNLP